MDIEEIPLVFECNGETLVGIVHLPRPCSNRGVVAMAAGGPQYRGGCARQLLYLGRRLAAAGTPVLRFDYRGLGDASGAFPGFEHTGDDLRAAIAAFHKQVPALTDVVLWGGCDAASASMINAPDLPLVSGLALGNPWVHSEATAEQAIVKHYYASRLRDPVFWRKLLTLRFNPLPAIATVSRFVARKVRGTSGQAGSEEQGPGPRSFQDKMRDGLQRFDGHLLLLMSGRSIVSREFDELVDTSKPWQQALASCATVTRRDLPEADQAFSSIAARNEVIDHALAWLASLPPSSGT